MSERATLIDGMVVGGLPDVEDIYNVITHQVGLSNEARAAWTQSTMAEAYQRGKNAVVLTNCAKVQGAGVQHKVHVFYLVEYHLYTSNRPSDIILERGGNGGFANWAFQGDNWVRYDNIVKFHASWNTATMGTAYQDCGRSAFPGWLY